jgi:hypothetical protein
MEAKFPQVALGVGHAYSAGAANGRRLPPVNSRPGAASPGWVPSSEACYATHNAPIDDQPPGEVLCWVGWAGVWRPLDLPQGLPHASPGAEPDNAPADSVEGCPRAGARSGCARSTGRHTSPACKINDWAITGPSDVEKH